MWPGPWLVNCPVRRRPAAPRCSRGPAARRSRPPHPTLTLGSVGTTFLTAPYRPNDNASPSPMTGGAPTSTVSTTTAATAMARATNCARLSRSRKISSPERHADQRVDEVAERGVDHVAVVDRVDVDHPVDRDQRRRTGQQQPGARGDRPDVAEPAHHGDDHGHQREAPHDPVRQHLERAGGLEQREERGEQPPHRVGADAVEQTGPAGVAHNSWRRSTSSACCRSGGYGLVISMRRPSAGCANASDRACSHCRSRPSFFASFGSAP